MFRSRCRLVVLLLVGTTACTAAGGGEGIQVARSFNVSQIPAAARRPAPPVEGPRLGEGPAITPADIDGAVVVLNFWGSWCGPCREEQPRLEALWKQYQDDGVRFVGVNTRRDQEAAALAFLREFDVTYPSIYDPASALAAAYGIRFMPATIVLDADGRIAARIVGAVRHSRDLGVLLDAELAA